MRVDAFLPVIETPTLQAATALAETAVVREQRRKNDEGVVSARRFIDPYISGYIRELLRRKQEYSCEHLRHITNGVGEGKYSYNTLEVEGGKLVLILRQVQSSNYPWTARDMNKATLLKETRFTVEELSGGNYAVVRCESVQGGEKTLVYDRNADISDPWQLEALWALTWNEVFPFVLPEQMALTAYSLEEYMRKQNRE